MSTLADYTLKRKTRRWTAPRYTQTPSFLLTVLDLNEFVKYKISSLCVKSLNGYYSFSCGLICSTYQSSIVTFFFFLPSKSNVLTSFSFGDWNLKQLNTYLDIYFFMDYDESSVVEKASFAFVPVCSKPVWFLCNEHCTIPVLRQLAASQNLPWPVPLCLSEQSITVHIGSTSTKILPSQNLYMLRTFEDCAADFALSNFSK